MLAEGIARERYEMEVRDKAQEKVSYHIDWVSCEHVMTLLSIGNRMGPNKIKDYSELYLRRTPSGLL